MAKVVPITRQRGIIQTTEGKIDYTIKKAFKGALNYTVNLDGAVKFQDLTIEGAEKKLKEYIAFWK